MKCRSVAVALGAAVAVGGLAAGAAVAEPSGASVAARTAAVPGVGPAFSIWYSVSANGVRLRTGPGTSHPAIGLLNKSDALSLVSTSGSWDKLRLLRTSKSGMRAGTVGWVSDYYVVTHLN